MPNTIHLLQLCGRCDTFRIYRTILLLPCPVLGHPICVFEMCCRRALSRNCRRTDTSNKPHAMGHHRHTACHHMQAMLIVWCLTASECQGLMFGSAGAAAPCICHCLVLSAPSASILQLLTMPKHSLVSRRTLLAPEPAALLPASSRFLAI